MALCRHVRVAVGGWSPSTRALVAYLRAARSPRLCRRIIPHGGAVSGAGEAAKANLSGTLLEVFGCCPSRASRGPLRRELRRGDGVVMAGGRSRSGGGGGRSGNYFFPPKKFLGQLQAQNGTDAPRALDGAKLGGGGARCARRQRRAWRWRRTRTRRSAAVARSAVSSPITTTSG